MGLLTFCHKCSVQCQEEEEEEEEEEEMGPRSFCRYHIHHHQCACSGHTKVQQVKECCCCSGVS